MITDSLLEELRYRGESSDLDYKSEQYLFVKASDEEKSELLKDILALANTYRDSSAYILIGFKENPPHPAEVVGLSPESSIDDSRIQEFVNGKLETKLTFRYEERLFDNKFIAVISIPKQQRPFYLKKDFGKLKKEVVYVRRGSSTGIASPREIALMGAANKERGDAQIQLILQTHDNNPLSDRLEREFVRVSDRIPDFKVDRHLLSVSTIEHPNKDYWREYANFYATWKRVIQVRLSILNHSTFSLGDTYLEVKCNCPEGESASLLRVDDMPEQPKKFSFGFENLRSMLEHSKRLVVVDDRGSEPIVQIKLGTVRPGQTIRAEEDLAILPSGTGHYALQVKIFANEIPTPRLLEYPVEVFGSKSQLDEYGIYELVSGGMKDNEA